MSAKLTDNTSIFTLYTEMAYGISPTHAGQGSITRQQLIDLLKQAEAQHRGTNFFSVSQVTKETTNKAPVPKFSLGGLKYGATWFAKVSQVNGQIGFDYTAAVNRQREKEGNATDFVATASTYNAVEGSRCLQEKEGQLYLYYRPMSVAKAFAPVYVKAADDTASSFEVIPKDQVTPYKAAMRPGVYQGLEQGVEVRKISVDSIAAINIAGKDYVITDLDDTRKKIYAVSGAPKPVAPPAAE